MTCENARAGSACRTAELTETLTIRYALIAPRGGAASPNATVVDFGGPGSSLFGQDWPGESLQLIADTLRTNVLAFEEPWVNAPYPEGCRDAAAQWYASLHEGLSADTSGFAARCELGTGRWGWTPSTYALAVEKALDAESLALKAFVGASFAGIRLSYLEDVPQTAILVSPYALQGTADQYLLSRVRSTSRFCVSRRAASCDDFSPMTAGSRSIPVTPFDVGAAWIAANYQAVPSEARKLVMQGDRNGEIVGALSDAVTGRFGVEDVSPSTFAYFAELCPRFSGWATASTPPGLAGRFLQEWHEVCEQIDSSTADNAEGHLQKSLVCVVASRDDGVVPAVLSKRAWAGVADKFVMLSGAAHGVVDEGTLEACKADRAVR